MPLTPELRAFLESPAISQAYLCEQLYGDKNKTNTGKLANKRKGTLEGSTRRKFDESELARLEQIRLAVLQQLCP